MYDSKTKLQEIRRDMNNLNYQEGKTSNSHDLPCCWYGKVKV